MSDKISNKTAVVLLTLICLFVVFLTLVERKKEVELIFDSMFGIENPNSLSDEERRFVQLYVTKRLQELRNDLEAAKKEKFALFSKNDFDLKDRETEELIRRVAYLENLMQSRAEELERAEKAARYFSFDTK